MGKLFVTTLAFLLVLCAQSGLALAADEAADLDKEASQIEEIKTKDQIWNQQLKEKYALTEEQMKALHDSGVSYPQMAMAAQLSKSSQKPLADVLKMRTEQKMGWGQIAKELGLPPKEIGQSVRDLKHAIRDERKIARAEKKEERKEKTESKHMDKAEKRERHGKKQ